jgi:hypothetical protein
MDFGSSIQSNSKTIDVKSKKKAVVKKTSSLNNGGK